MVDTKKNRETIMGANPRAMYTLSLHITLYIYVEVIHQFI